MKKRFLALSLALCMLLSCVPFASAASFSDIAGHWARESILAMADQNIITGYPDGTFRPNGTITRAELLTLVVRRYASGVTPSTLLPSDVAAGDWYADTVRRALGANLIPSAMIASNRLDPNQAITREEAAAVLALALNLPASTASLTYTDRASISVWAVESVAQCSENGIFGGYPDGGFHPQGTITRAEVAAVLSRAGGTLPGDGSAEVNPVQQLVLNVTGTDNLAVDTISDLTITTNPTVVRVQVRDIYGNIIGEKADAASSTWVIPVRPVREGEQSFTIHASVVYGVAFDNTPALTVPVTVSSRAAQTPTVISAEPSTQTPLSGSTVAISVTTNNAATCVALYDAAGVRVADSTAYTVSGSYRLWLLDYTVPAGASARTLTVCPGDADGYDTDNASHCAKLTLNVIDSTKLPTVTSVKASTETPIVGDTVTITVTTNLYATRVKLVDALGSVISEKTSGYTTSGSTRTWKFSMRADTAGVSWVRAYAGSSGGYSDTVGGEITLTISEKAATVRDVSASTTTPVVGQPVTITVTTDTSVQRVKLTDASGTTLNTTTTYRTSGTRRIWTLSYTPTTTGQKNLRVCYGASSTGNYSSVYTGLVLTVGTTVSGLTVSDVSVSNSTPTVGQAVTVTVTTDRQVSKLKVTDIFGNVLATVSSGYIDGTASRVWTLSLTPTSAGLQQYFVTPGNAYGYGSGSTAFVLTARSVPTQPGTAPAVTGVSIDKTTIYAGDVVTVTITTNTAAESVRLIDSNGIPISSTGNYETSGSSRVWEMTIQILQSGYLSGYVQAAGNGYAYSASTAQPIALNVGYTGTPVIHSVSQGSRSNLDICSLNVVTNQNVNSVSVITGSGYIVSTTNCSESGSKRTWTLSWVPSSTESTTVTVYAYGGGTASYSYTWSR